MKILKTRARGLPLPGLCLGLVPSAALLLMTPVRVEPATTASYWDITADAVQTHYQDGVPHTDVNGNLRQTYDPDSSFLPLSIYGARVCATEEGISWPAYTGPSSIGSWTWSGKYHLVVDLVDVPPSNPGFLQPQDRVRVHDAIYETTTALVNKLPADENLRWTVVPDPSLQYILETWQVHATDEMGPLPCLATDVDDPNIIETLANGGFNLALSGQHPAPFVRLKKASGASDFKLVHFAAQRSPVSCYPVFTEDLFRASPEGQGYSQDTVNIYGWQTEDEPLAWSVTPNPPNPCIPQDYKNDLCLDNNMDGLPDLMVAALNRLQEKYDAHKETIETIHHVEAVPTHPAF